MLIQIPLLFAAVFLIWYMNNKKEQPQLSPLSLLCIVLQAAIPAAAAGSFVWMLGAPFPETYTDFAGGFLAMASMGKSYEYNAFYCGLLLFILLFCFLRKLYGKWQASGREEMAQQVALYSLIPAAIMAGQTVFVRNFLPLMLVSAAGVLTGTVVLSAGTLLKNKQQPLAPLLLLSSLFLAGGSCYCAGVAGNRLGLPLFPLMVLFCAVLLCYSVKRENWHLLLTASQAGLPLGFCYLLPPEMVLKNGEIFDAGFNILPRLIVIVLILTSWYSLAAALRKRSECFTDCVPTMPLLAFVSLFCALPDTWPGIHGDDYHNSEIVLPWFSLVQQGAVPYIDYVPSRGGINYLPGFLLWLFKGHDFSFLNSMMKWADLPLYGIALAMLRRKTGLIAALAGLLTLTGLSPIMGAGVLCAFLCWLWLAGERWDNRPTAFLCWFVLLGIGGVIYSLTDFLPMYIAMFPLAFYAVWDSFMTERKSFYRFCIAVAVCAAAVLAVPLLRNMCFAVLDILFLQSGSYTTVHCVPHMPGMNKSPVTSGVLWDCFRYGFIVMGGIFCATLLFLRPGGKREFRRYLALAALAILSIIMIQRAGGRVDVSNYSRIYIFSSLVWAVFIPVWYKTVVRQQKYLHIFCAAVFFIGCGVYGKQMECLENLTKHSSGKLYEPENTVNPAKEGLPALGRNAALDAGHYKHHLQIRDFLKTILKPGETVWDLANNAALYAYHDLPIAMRYPAYFYAGEPKLAQKLAGEVAKNLPVLALIEGRNIEFHEGKLPLRAYPLYKLLLDNYRVFKDVNGKVWMIRKGEEKRLENNKMVQPGTLDDITILADAVADKKIDGYPKTWGASVTELAEKLQRLMTPGANQYMTSPQGIKLQPGSFSGDFLLLRFDRPIASRMIRVQWQDDFNGKGRNSMDFWGGAETYLVPLSTAPNWYLSGGGRDIEISFSDPQTEAPQLLECSFWKRK